MSKPVIVIVTLAVVAGLALAGYALLRGPTAHDSAQRRGKTEPSAVHRDRIQILSKRQPKSTPAQLRVAAPSAGDLPDVVAAAMTPPANAGEPTAMRYLGESLHRCARAARGSDEELEKRRIDLQLQLEDALRSSGVATDRSQQAKAVAASTEQDRALRDACARLDPAQVSAWMSWLERAALAGDAEAKRDYAKYAFQDYLEHGVPPSDLDEAVRRRDLVREFSEDLLAEGDCSALSGLQWSVPDPVTAYAYQIAYVQRTREQAIRQGADPDGFAPLDDFLAAQDARLSESQRAAARADAAYVLQHFCQG